MFVMALYVDNLDRVHYDIPLIIKNWKSDRIILFSGSDDTTHILQNCVSENERMSIIHIDKRIIHPIDIPIAFNTCEDYCYDVLGAEAVAMVAADILVTINGMEYLDMMYEKSEIVVLSYDHVQLYNYMWVAPTGVVLSYSDRRMHRLTNGDQLEYYADGINYNKQNYYDPSLLRDVGYFTIGMYRNKMYSHNFIWPDPYKTSVVKAFDRSIEDGLRMAYKKIKEYCPLSPIDANRYANLFEHFQCLDEYYQCVNVMRSL